MRPGAPPRPSRVFLYGPPGAGKTTLALALGREWGLPAHHLDALFFRPGGAPVDRSVGVETVAGLVRRDAWVIEGNHGAALEMVASRAERVVLLRLGRWRSLWRIARRRLRTPPDLADKGPGGGPQILPWHLVRHTVLHHPRIEPSHHAIIAHSATGPVACFRCPRDARRWLETRPP